MTRPTPVSVPSPALPLADPADRATFSARKLEHLRWERNDLAPGVEDLAQVAKDNADDAYASSGIAAASAVSAAGSEANTAALANFKGNWSALTGALAKPASVFHNGAFWALLNNLADVTASQPGVSADWQVCGGAWPIIRINSNTTAQPWRTYVFYGACTLTAPAISGNGKQFGVVVLPGVSGAIFAPAGVDKTRGASGSQPIDAPFTATLTDSGATHGWI
jgi:hypothetical protein